MLDLDYDAVMRVVDYYCDFLRARQHDRVFGVPGSYVNPLWQALTERGPTPVLCRHESGAAFMADGWARACGRPGVVLTTIGPGLTNSLTGVASAYYDSIPMLIVSGYSSAAESHKGGFQDRIPPDRGFDPSAFLAPITKHSFLASTGREAVDALRCAYALSIQGRPGPVHIALRLDAQTEDTDTDEPPGGQTQDAPVMTAEGLTSAVLSLSQRIASSQRPLLLVGGGCITRAAHRALRQLQGVSRIPTVSSIKGVPSCSFDSGDYWGVASPSVISPSLRQRLVDYNSDCVIALGSSLSSASFDLHMITSGRPVAAHVDLDSTQFGRYWLSELCLPYSVELVLEELSARRLPTCCVDGPAHAQPSSDDSDFAHIVSRLDDLAPPDSIVVADAGNHYLDTLYWYRPRGHYSLFANAGLASMGYAIGAAIGLCIGFPERPVICITGDASFLMYGTELSTAVNLGLDILFLVSNNHGMGRMRYAYAASGASGESGDIRNVSVSAIARGLGSEAFRIDNPTDFEHVFRGALNRSGVRVIEIMIEDEDVPRVLRR